MARLLTPDQVAEQAQCSRRTVMRAIARGELEASQLARRGVWRIRPPAVDRWIASRTAGVCPVVPLGRRRPRRLAVVSGMGRAA